MLLGCQQPLRNRKESDGHDRNGKTEVAGTGAPQRRPVHGRPGHRHRECRAAVDPGRSRVLPGEPAVGDQRVRALLRRVPAPGRPLADLLGRRRIFLGGLVVFTLASLFAGLAWSEASLIGACLPGTRRGDHHPAALSILSTTFHEGRERNIALGVWGAVGGFRGRRGVLMGGILPTPSAGSGSSSSTSPSGYSRSSAPILLDESRDSSVKTFDLPGAALVTAGLSSPCLRDHTGRAGRLLPCRGDRFAASLVLLAGFVGWDRRHPEPLMRFGLLQQDRCGRVWRDSSPT